MVRADRSGLNMFSVAGIGWAIEEWGTTIK